MTGTKAAAVKSHFGSLAIAVAIVIAAIIFGFVSSKAFAVFLLYLVGALALAGIGVFFLSVAHELGWIGAIIVGMIFLGALTTLGAGVNEALTMLKAA